MLAANQLELQFMAMTVKKISNNNYCFINTHPFNGHLPGDYRVSWLYNLISSPTVCNLTKLISFSREHFRTRTSTSKVLIVSNQHHSLTALQL